VLKFARCDYIGAVAEHTVFQGSDSDSSSFKLSKNLDIYEGLIQLAKSKSVQILVFPEFGLTPGPAAQRSDVYPYIESIPKVDPSNLITPCNNTAFSDRPILSRMSCAAKSNQLEILINMINNIPCDVSSDSNCPSDNHYQYNTDVVFNKNGEIATIYPKSHEWPGLQSTYDQVPAPSQVTYKSSFGVEFGIFICFDIMWEDPPKVLRSRGIEHFLYAVQQGDVGEKTIIEPWSKNNEAVVLSANLGSGKKDDCSGLIVNGTPLNAAKYHLSSSEFADENILVATVPAK